MIKFFNFFKSLFFRKNKKKIILFLFASVFFILMSIVFIKTIYDSWWIVYPRSVRRIISLNRLAILVYKDPLCRLDCHLARAPFRKEIISSLSDESFSFKIKKIIFNEEENTNWRVELIRVISMTENPENLPIFNYLRDYLVEPEGNLEFKQSIYMHFSYYLKNNERELYNNNLKDKISDDSQSLDDRILALKTLSSVAGSFDFSYFYLHFLELNISDDFNIELLRALGSDVGLFNLERDKLFLILTENIYSPNSSFTSRRLAIFILSDFLEKDCNAGSCKGDFLEESTRHSNAESKYVKEGNVDNLGVINLFYELILDENVDKFSHYLLTETLNHYVDERFSLPELSAEDWSYYYNN